MSKEELLARLEQAVMAGDEEAAGQVAQETLEAGIDPLEAIEQGAVKSLNVLGERYQRLEAFLPELTLAGDAMKAVMAVLVPHIKQEQMAKASRDKLVIGTVFGDVHGIGKNLVAAMAGINGFEVYDLGVDVPVKQFIEKAAEVEAKIIGLSSLMTTSAYYQEEVIKYLKEAGLREKYYVVVGGGPITPQWTVQIGADGYGRNAPDAVQLLKRLVAEGVPPPLSQPIIIGE